MATKTARFLHEDRHISWGNDVESPDIDSNSEAKKI